MNKNFDKEEEEKILTVVRERKKIEKNSEMLNNRIALLEFEEKKLSKKTKATQKKINEILKIKKINEEKEIEKNKVKKNL